MAAGVKLGRKPKLSKRKERELLETLGSVVISKEDLARQFMFQEQRFTGWRPS